MEDRRFDALVKSLAAGTNRRTVLKGLLGLGGAVAASGALLDGDALAARRPTPTPKPPTCPGQQYWNGTECECPDDAPDACGPDCCTGDVIPHPTPGHSECCDGACCFGTCYGEELCCPTNDLGTDLFPLIPSHKLCEGPNGPYCCETVQHCCLEDGCCDTLCYGGMVGDSFCCPAERVCAGETSEGDICCFEGEACCNGGTDANRCSATGCDDGGNEGCRQCDDQGLDCCFINDDFAGCWDSSDPSACCTADTCGLDDFEHCLTSGCISFSCQQVPTCAGGQYCCDGECSDEECLGSTQCSSDADCGGDIVCCGGTCCTTGQSCITQPDGNTYCA